MSNHKPESSLKILSWDYFLNVLGHNVNLDLGRNYILIDLSWN